MGRRKKEPIPVNAIWLRRIGDETQVLVNVAGRWRLVIQEQFDGNFSHIVEPGGIAKSKLAQMDTVR